jgi:hypothetical protein
MQTAFVILNGVNITDQCKGVEELSEKIYFDAELRGYLREMQGELVMTGDTYRFIQNRFKSDFDNPIPISLSVLNPHTETYESVFNGVIFPSDCEFDLYANEVTCQLVDITFFAKINNNKNLKFTINAGESKLGVDISNRGGEIDYQNVTTLWTDPSTGQPYSLLPVSTAGLLGRATKAITLYQALDYLVAAMTDGDVEFFSSYLTDSPTTESYVIMSGAMVRMEDPLIARRPYVSWVELFGDLSKQFNLVMAVEEVQVGRYRIRVEPYDYWRQQSIIELTEISPRVKERADISLLPSSVLLGSAKVEKKLNVPSADITAKTFSVFWIPPASTTYFDFVPLTPFIYHWQEEYNYTYQSNVDAPQTFRHSVCITDTKLYQYQVSQYFARFVLSGFDTESDINETYEEDVFLIASTPEITYSSVPITVRRPVVYAEPFFFIINKDINNQNTMQRNLSVIPASASLLYSTLSVQSFRAYYETAGGFAFVQKLDANNQNSKRLYFVFGTTGTGGEFIGNTTYFGASGVASIIGGVGPPNVNPVPPSTNIRVVLGYNDITTQGFDNSGNYNSTAFSWTVSVTAIYSFRIFLEFFTTKLAGATLCHWDSSGVLLRGIRLGTASQGVNWLGGIGNVNQYQTVNQTVGGYSANAGDVFQIILEVATQLGQNDTIDGDVYLSEDSYWEIQGSSLPSSGGTIINIDSGTNYFVENELEGYVPADTWAQIRSNPFNKYRYLVSDDGTNRVGFLKDFSRNIISGKFNGVTIPETLTPNDNNTIQSDGETEPEEPEE